MRRPNRLVSSFLVIVPWAGLVLAGGCERSGGGGKSDAGTGEGTAALCSPRCNPDSCGDDGCGKTCSCSNGTACSAAHVCTAPAECLDTCQGARWQCGTLCGASCGTCPSGQECFWNRCYPAPVNVSCPECGLRLSVASKELTSEGNLSRVVLEIHYTPSPQAPARMADLWVYANADVELESAVPGSALADSNKVLFSDPTSQKTFKLRADKSYQLLALSLSNTNPIAAGRVATLTFKFKSATAGPVPFKLVHHPTLAPSAADNALDSLPYDSAVVVTAQ